MADPVTDPVNFPEAFQGYFTALDELAKAVIAENETDQAHRAHEREYGFVFAPGDPLIEIRHELWHKKDKAIDDTVAAADRFYQAHLALKPFLGDGK